MTEADKALLAWNEARERLEMARKDEAEARARVLKTWFEDEGVILQEGKNPIALANGYKLVAAKSVTRKIDDAVLRAMWQELSEMMPVGMLVRNKPELNLRAYRMLTDEQRGLFDKVLEVKDGAVSLRIEQ